MAPVSERILVKIKPMLLGTHHHSRTNHPHIGYTLVGGEPVSINKMGSDKTPGAAKASLTVDRNLASVVNNGFGSPDELLDIFQRGTGAIVKDHVDVLDATTGELGSVVEMRIESDNELDIVGEEKIEYFFERFV